MASIVAKARTSPFWLAAFQARPIFLAIRACHASRGSKPGSERACFDARLFPEVPSAMRAAWAAEKAALPAALPGGGGKDAAQALLGKACAEGDLGAVKRAVAAGGDPNKRAHGCNSGTVGGGRFTAVLVAAINGNVRELRFLLAAAGADPNLDNGNSGAKSSSGKHTPCFYACTYHRHDCVRVLLALGATPDHFKYGCTCPGDIARR